MVKNLPAMQETWVRFPSWEDPLGKGMATHSSILAWRIPWTEKPGGLQSRGCKESDPTEQLGTAQHRLMMYLLLIICSQVTKCHQVSSLNQELPDVLAGFRKGRGTRDQIANIRWILENAREFHENTYFCFIDYTKAFQLSLCGSHTNSVDHNKLWEILRDGNTRPLYLPPEKPVCRSRSNRTKHGIMDQFQIGKRVHQGYILLSCLFNFYAESIMQNAELDEAQAGIKIAGRNINNLG